MTRLARRCGIAALPLLLSPAAAQVRWTASSPPLAPAPRNQVHLADLAPIGRAFLFGGQLASGYSNETWLFDGVAWQQVTGPGPSARAGGGCAYDSLRDVVVLFSGWNGGRYQPDTWEFDAATQSWTAVSTASSPPGRDWLRMAFHPPSGRVVLFGGHIWNASPNLLGDTWLYDGSNWTQATPTTSPPARWGHNMVYDPISRKVLLFGGQVQGVGQGNDMWQWDGSDWAPLATPAAPPARVFAGMTYDPSRQRVVLFGGNVAGAPANDLWEWDGTLWFQRTSASGSPSPRAWAEIEHVSSLGGTLLFGGATQIPRGGNVADTWLYGPVTPARANAFGSGCSGSAGTPDLACGNLVWASRDYQVTLSMVPPGGSAFFMLGLSDQRTSGGIPLPLSLSFLGIPCTLYVDPLVVPVVPSASGRVDLRFRVARTPTIVGTALFAQGGALDLTAPGGLTFANACRHVVGGL